MEWGANVGVGYWTSDVDAVYGAAEILFAPVSFLNRAMALVAAGCLVYPSSTSRLVGSLLAIALMFRNRQKAL